MKRSPGIYLVGFMGCGKSTVGAALAEKIGWNFVDLDRSIEEQQGRLIIDIFEKEGEPAFRQIESEAIQHLIKETYKGRATVAALGGGTFPWPGNRERLEDSGVTVWLEVPFARIEARIASETHRPLARDPKRFRELFDARREAYAKADYTIPFDSDHAQDAVQAILALHLLG